MLAIPSSLYPNNAIFQASLPRPLTWQLGDPELHFQRERRVLLAHIGHLLLQQHGMQPTEVTTEPAAVARKRQIWLLARRLEAFLFIESSSFLEYSNLHSLPRRVQAMAAAIINKQIRKTQAESKPHPLAHIWQHNQARRTKEAQIKSATGKRQREVEQQEPEFRPQQTRAVSVSQTSPRTQLGEGKNAKRKVDPNQAVSSGDTGYAPSNPNSARPQLPVFGWGSSNQPTEISSQAPMMPVNLMNGFHTIDMRTKSSSAAQGYDQQHFAPLESHHLEKSAQTWYENNSSTVSKSPFGSCETDTSTHTCSDIGEGGTKWQELGEHDVKHGEEKKAFQETYLFAGNYDVHRLIFSYLDGKDVLRCRSVCHQANEMAPKLVSTLRISCNMMLRCLLTPVGSNKRSVLYECNNLNDLEVYSLSAEVDFSKHSMQAIDCPQRFVVTHEDHEYIVRLLSEIIMSGSLEKLTRLSIICLFTNDEANGEANVLINSLMVGACPNLEELCLPGNSVGDYGAYKAALLLRSGACPNLKHIDLRRNFIGEKGVHHLSSAFQDGFTSKLEGLCLGGNTITDSSITHLLQAMESHKLKRLKFLGLEMNCLTEKGIVELGTTIGKLVCPYLNKISYSKNSLEDMSAKKVLVKAIYVQRIKNQQQGGGDDVDEEDDEDEDCEEDDEDNLMNV